MLRKTSNLVMQSVLGKNSALLMFSPDRLIGKLISNIALSMRENYQQLKGINVFREGAKSVASLLFADMQMFLILQWYTCRKRLPSNELGMHISYNTTGKVFFSRKLVTFF